MNAIYENLFKYKEIFGFVSGLITIFSGIAGVFGVLEKLGIIDNVKVWKRIKEKITKRQWTGICVVSIILFFLSFSMYLHIGRLVEVPDVEKKLYSDAKGFLIEEGLDFIAEQGKEYYFVIEQSPAAKSIVPKGTMIKLVLAETITPSPVQYGYYHYTDGTNGEYSVCAYSGANHYGWDKTKIYREEICVDEPLMMISESDASYKHIFWDDKCPEYGCEDEEWIGGAYRDENGVIWYREIERK